MNYFLSVISIAFLLLQGCNSSKKVDQVSKYSVEKIQINKIDLLGSVMTKVECEKFSQSVGKGDVEIVIKDPAKIDPIMNSISKSPSTSSDDTPDTKAVIEIFFLDGHSERLCVGNFSAVLDGQFIQLDDSLKNYLMEL